MTHPGIVAAADTVRYTITAPGPAFVHLGDTVTVGWVDGRYLTGTVARITPDGIEVTSCARCGLATAGHDPGFCAAKAGARPSWWRTTARP